MHIRMPNGEAISPREWHERKDMDLHRRLLSCFKNLPDFYRITGNPEERKIMMRSTVVSVIPLAYNVRLEWSHHYEHRNLSIRLVIDRPAPPNGRLLQYGLETVNIRIESTKSFMSESWYNARNKGLLRVWMKFKNNKHDDLGEVSHAR